MKSLKDIQSKLKSAKGHLERKYKVKRFGIFGSYSRGEEDKTSDIDILVEFKEPIGLEFVDLADELEVILNHKVDLVSRGGVKSKYLPYIEEDLIYV